MLRVQQGQDGAKGDKGDQGDAGPQGAAGNDGNDGTDGVSLRGRGPWNDQTNYIANDAVRYNNSFYMALAPNNNARPDTSTGSWMLVSNDGAQGQRGPAGRDGIGAHGIIILYMRVRGTSTPARPSALIDANGSLSNITTGWSDAIGNARVGFDAATDTIWASFASPRISQARQGV